MKKALGTLKGKARVKRTMWSRRAQEYEAKINSGALVSIAEVVRDLYRSEAQPEQSYSERQVIKAIGKADVVFFGIDRDEPVLDAEDIRDCRDFTARPLTVIDFNTFGSTKRLETIPGVTLVDAKTLDDAVDSFADSMCASDEFSRALRAAESWIERRVPVLEGTSTQPQRCRRSALRDKRNTGEDKSARTINRWRTCAHCARESVSKPEEAEEVALGSVADGC